MQTITIDLKKIPEVADFLADKEPGDEVCLIGTIKSLDDQAAVVTITEFEDREEKDDDAEEPVPGAEDDHMADRRGQGEKQAGASPDALRDISGGEKASYG